MAANTSASEKTICRQRRDVDDPVDAGQVRTQLRRVDDGPEVSVSGPCVAAGSGDIDVEGAKHPGDLPADRTCADDQSLGSREILGRSTVPDGLSLVLK